MRVLFWSKMLKEIMMKFPFHHRAFYCYLAMTLWIFFLITAMYKYISVGSEVTAPKKVISVKHLSRTDVKFRRIYMKTCNPPDNLVRGSEGAVDHDAWLLQGVLAITRHGDRGPLTHLRGGDKLPCDTVPPSPLLRSYEEFVHNASGGASRGPWASAPGPFHNFPSLPARAGASTPTHCALGQLTSTGLLQMLRVGAILRSAYAEKLGLDAVDVPGKNENGEVVTYSTRYRRTYQSLLGALWGLHTGSMARRAARAKESHSVAFCFRDCACPALQFLNKKLGSQAKGRLNAHPAIKDLVSRISKVIFESQENPNPEIVRDALLAYMCHDAPLPCSAKAPLSHGEQKEKSPVKKNKMNRRFRDQSMMSRSLLNADVDTLNLDLDYNQLDMNNELGRKARDIIGKYYEERDKKAPLDFDAQMEREKLLYYQQRYLDNADGYDDVVVVKKHLDADFNFPNDARLDADFDEENYKEATQENTEDFCVRNEHIVSLFAYLEWSYRQDLKNIHNKRRGLLTAYGLMHNIVQNMIRMISENRPKFVLYSGHDKTLHPLILALGLRDFQHYTIKYASRIVFELYRKRDLRDEFKFTKRKAIAQDFYFRVVYNGADVTNMLTFCRSKQNVVMKVVDPIDDVKVYNTYLCPIESIVRFIHDDYFAIFNVSNFKDACASYGRGKRMFQFR